LIDLNRLIRETVEAQRSAAVSPIEWVLDLNPIPKIRGNLDQLRSLLGYLIDNAREAMPKGAGSVTFRTHVDARNWVILEVRDTGGGMSPEVLKRATEPFFTTKPGRSGTGLTIAHGIWRRHRGALAIDSHPTQGTTIRLAVEAPSPSTLVPDPTALHAQPIEPTPTPPPPAGEAPTQP
jgi:signal transduction histidine kinase